MKAHSLSVCIPSHKEDRPVCDKNCPYCVSRMTGYTPYNRTRWYRAQKKVLTLAKMACVTNVMMTGKGEPTLNYYELVSFIQKFHEFPVELQTNGLWLNDNVQAVSELAKIGLDVMAISIDRMSDFEKLAPLFEAVKTNGLMLRICMNVVSSRYMTTNVYKILETTAITNADQLLFRRVTIPVIIQDSEEAGKTRSWIVNNVDFELYETLHSEFRRGIIHDKDLIRKLPHGAYIYDYKNQMSVSFSDYCVQESNNTEDIRSLIFMEDGHIYTSWDKKSSILL